MNGYERLSLTCIGMLSPVFCIGYVAGIAVYILKK